MGPPGRVTDPARTIKLSSQYTTIQQGAVIMCIKCDQAITKVTAEGKLSPSDSHVGSATLIRMSRAEGRGLAQQPSPGSVRCRGSQRPALAAEWRPWRQGGGIGHALAAEWRQCGGIGAPLAAEWRQRGAFGGMAAWRQKQWRHGGILAAEVAAWRQSGGSPGGRVAAWRQSGGMAAVAAEWRHF